LNDMMNDNNIPQQEGMEEQQTRVVPTVDTPARPPRHRRSDRYAQEQPAQEAPQQPVQSDMPSWLNQQAEAAPQQDAWITPPAEQEPASEENNPTTRVQTRFTPRQDAQQAVPRPAVLGRQQGQQGDVRRPMNVPGYTQRQPLGTGPVQPQPRQPLYPQQQEAPARRNQPQNAPEKKKKKGRGWLVALVAIVLLLGLCVLGFLMIDETSDSPLAEAKRSVVSLLGGALPTEAPPVATASGFSAAINTGTAPPARIPPPPHRIPRSPSIPRCPCFRRIPPSRPSIRPRRRTRLRPRIPPRRLPPKPRPRRSSSPCCPAISASATSWLWIIQ